MQEILPTDSTELLMSLGLMLTWMALPIAVTALRLYKPGAPFFRIPNWEVEGERRKQLVQRTMMNLVLYLVGVAVWVVMHEVVAKQSFAHMYEELGFRVLVTAAGAVCGLAGVVFTQFNPATPDADKKRRAKVVRWGAVSVSAFYAPAILGMGFYWAVGSALVLVPMTVLLYGAKGGDDGYDYD